MIGRALTTRGRWIFEPAKRGRRVPLHWRGAAAPEDGDYCIAEVDFEQARLVEVLGADDRPAWDDAAVASQYRLRQVFDPAAEREAESFSAPGPRELHGRLDLRERLVFTIDPEDARDHDDALHWGALGHGRHEVGIHIADVSHYVTPDSALDREAHARGLSCYLPGSVVPMLPGACRRISARSGRVRTGSRSR
jgi:exoribonuclease R